MNEAPKILHIITRLDFGGSAIHTINAIDRLRNHDFQTAIAFGLTRDPDNSVRELLANRKIPFFYLPNLVRNPSPRRDICALNDILKLLKKERFDLVHTHTSKVGTLGRLAARWHGIPAVHTPHGHIFYGYFKPLVTAFYVSVERWMARYTARIISLTDNETRESLERGIGRPEQYATIPSGVPNVIQDRWTGLLVAGEDPDALARALSEMTFNDELRLAMGKNAAGSISPEYDEEASVARIAALYREVLGVKERV